MVKFWRIKRVNIKIKPELRRVYAEKTLDLTNIGAGALLFGQFISDQSFSWITTSLGLLVVASGYVIAYLLYQGGGL